MLCFVVGSLIVSPLDKYSIPTVIYNPNGFSLSGSQAETLLLSI